MVRSAKRKAAVVRTAIAKLGGRIDALEPRVLLSAQYTWQNAAIGAGGFVDGVFYDPSNANVIYARTDIGGLWKTTNDGQNWSQLLSFVGQSSTTSGNSSFWGELGVLSFAIDPNNSNNIYAEVGNTGSTADGALLYSSNGGTTWGTTLLPFAVNGNSNGRGDGERLAVDPNNSNVIYIGSNAGIGVYRSVNKGLSFAQISGGNLATSTQISFIAIPSNSQSSQQSTTSVTVSGSPVTVSSDIYLGIDSTSGTSTEVAESFTGGTTFTTLTGTGTLPNKWIPGHAEFSGGFLYLGYANGLQPNTNATNGGVYRFTPGASASTGAWANITPQTPGGSNGVGGNYPTFGYDSIGVDANGVANGDPNTLVVTTVDDYSGPDQIWRTVNANVATPTWTEIFDVGATGNFGFGGFNSTRNTANAPWIAAFGDGIGNWAATVAINPFNTNQVMYGTGQGLWATNNASNGGANTQLTSPNSWYFLDNGIEFTASIQLTAPTAGVPLLSALGDINGFEHTTLTSSPTAGSILSPGQNNTGNPNTSATGALNNDTGVAVAGQNPNDIAYVGSGGVVSFSVTSLSQTGGVATAVTASTDHFYMGQSVTIAGASIPAYNAIFSITSILSPTSFTFSIASATASPASGTITASVNTYGAYSTNGGSTWAQFLANSAGNGSGTVGMAADGSAIAWAPSGQLPFYSTNDGTTWTAASMPAGTATGGTVTADRVNASVFYYSTENSGDNSWQLYISTNGGVSFTIDGAAQGNGNVTLVANPYIAGDLWFSSYIGIYHSTNYGASFAQNSVIGYDGVPTMALGAPAPGQTTAAIYIYGQIGSFTGVYRSDDGGTTWTSLNTTSQQFGGEVDEMAADPNVFGRVYLGTNGQGIFVGNPSSSLPANWSDADINTPGNPGWASSSTTLSTGTTVNQWIVDGGGAGITGTSDQFNFASEPITGDAAITAQLLSMTNADGGNGTPVAGVMYRASNNAGDPFAAMVQTAGNSLVFEYRATGGGTVSSVTLNSVPVGSEYVQVVRSGSNFSGYYSSNGISWTQLGSTVSIAAMGATASVGLAASASYNPQLTAVTFTNVSVVPFVYSDVSGANTYAIDLNATNPALLQIFVNAPETGTPTYTIAASQVPSLLLEPSTGNDSLTVDFANGSPVPLGGVNMSGGSGNDTLLIQGNAGSITSGQVSISGSSGSDTLTVNGGTYSFAGDPEASTSSFTLNDNSAVIFQAASSGGTNALHLAVLNVGSGATAMLATPGSEANRSLLITGSLSIAPTGLLDMGGNDMIVQSGVESTIYNELKSGFNAGAGYWNGNYGIISSAAAGDTTYLTTLGERASDGSLFDGVTPSAGNVLVKYTLYGDADVNGVLNGADYQQIDNGFGNQLAGWSNGDFNYDGAVDGSDYSLLDNAFNQANAGAAPLAVVTGPATLAPSPAAKTAGAQLFATTPLIAAQGQQQGTIENIWSALEDEQGKVPYLFR